MNTTAHKIANSTKKTIAAAEKLERAIAYYPWLASTTLVRRTGNVVQVESDHTRSIDAVLALQREGASVMRQERSNGSSLPTTVLVFVF